MPIPSRNAETFLQAPDVARYRQAFRRTAGGVWVITAAHAGQRTGFTATSIVSLATEPAELMMSVQTASSSFPLLQSSARFGANLLKHTQQAIADQFAGRDGCQGEARYARAPWWRTSDGVWLLDDASVAMACEVSEVLWRRTHALVFGRVVALRLADDLSPPLVYADGRYTGLAPR